MSESVEPHVTVHDPRYAMIPERLLYDPKMPADAVRVYGVLQRHGNDPTNCYPGYDRIARLIGASKRSVGGWMRQLEAGGWVERIPRWTKAGDPDTHGYHVFASPLPLDERGVMARQALEKHEAEGGGALHSAPGVRVGQRAGCALDSALNENQLNESKSQNLRGASSEAPEELFPEPAPPPKPAPPTRPRSATTSQTATRPERRPEPRPAWDALVAEKGCAPETKSEKNRLGKVLKEITEALRVEYPDISPLEEAKAIHARANRYKQRYGADRFTETALMNHWAECGPRARLVDAPGPAPG